MIKKNKSCEFTRGLVVIFAIMFFLMTAQNARAFGLYFAWTYDGELYDASSENLKGTVFWTVETEEKPNAENTTEDGYSILDRWFTIYSMDLATGQVNNYDLSGYLIYDDIEDKVLVAVEENETVELYQMDKEGNHELLLTARNVPMAQSAEGLPCSVLAYYESYLYVYQRRGEKPDWQLIRVNPEGDYYVYQCMQPGAACLSPAGLLAWSCLDSDPFTFNASYRGNSIMVENPEDGSSSMHKIPFIAEDQIIVRCIEWIDEQTVLFCVADISDDKTEYILCWCNVVTGESGQYPMVNGTYYSRCIDMQADCNSETHMLAYREDIFGGEGFYAVPAVADLNTGSFHALKEQQQTETFTETCTSANRVIWLE